MISAKQKMLLHVAARQLGLDRDHYEALLQEQAGVRSSSDLSNEGFDRVVARLEELGFHNTSRRPRRREPAAPVTPHQQAHIAELYDQLGWAELPRRMAFNRRQCRKSWPQTRTDANKVIEGLKAMLHRKGKEANLPPGAM